MPDFDFATSSTVDSLDSVPEQFRSVFEEKDGKFTVGESHKGIVEAVTGLGKALKNERAQHGDLKKAKDVSAAVKEALGELGIETLEQAKAKIGELTTTLAEKGKVDPAKIRQEIEQTFAAEKQTLLGKNEKMRGTLDRYLVKAEANAQLNAHKGNAKLLMPVISAQTKVVEDGEDFVVRVLDADGSYRGDGKGGFMTVADLVAELKASADYKVAFASDALGGGGEKNRTQQPSRQTQQREQRRSDNEVKSPQDLISAGLKARRQGR